MFDHVLHRMREKVRALAYVMTIHAEEEMEDDDISILDVEHVILTGEIIERQQDPRVLPSQATFGCCNSLRCVYS